MAQPQLRPMGFGEILDYAFTVYRRHFGTFFLTVLLPSLPVAVFWLFFGTATATAPPDQTSVLAGAASLLLLPYSLVAGVFAWGAMVHDSARAVTGEPVSLGSGYRRSLRRFFPLLGAAIVTVILVWIGFIFLIIPGILLAIMFFAVAPAVVIEDEGPLSALGRSRKLAQDGWLRILGILVITWFIVSIPSGAFFFGVGILAALSPGTAESMASGGSLNAVFQTGSVVVSALTTPFLITSLVVLYYDRRVRKEGLDLEVAAEQMSPAG